jgi:YidC/Oxa1 family membrane protein insertase
LQEWPDDTAASGISVPVCGGVVLDMSSDKNKNTSANTFKAIALTLLNALGSIFQVLTTGWFWRIAFSSVLVSLLFNHWFSKPAVELPIIPLNREIDFVDQRSKVDPSHVRIQTPLAEYEFSNVGGVVSGVSFKDFGEPNDDGSHKGLKTVRERGTFEREQGAFLLAFDEQTPLIYTLSGTNETDAAVEVVFTAQAQDNWAVTKTFVVYKDSYRFDVHLSFVPGRGARSVLRPRLFVPGPFLGDAKGNVQTGHIRLSESDGFVQAGSSDESTGVWSEVGTIAVDDHYFIHALVDAEPGFIRRTFFRRLGGNAGLSFIVEGTPIDVESDINLSFYLGPKLVAPADEVDQHLASIWASGIFSRLKRLILWLLILLFGYFKNYGWAIIVLTFALRLPFIPLNIYAQRKVIKYEEFRNRYKHVIDSISSRYKDSPMMQREEMEKLYHQHGLTVSGSFTYLLLPALVAAPLFMILYSLFRYSVLLYKMPFVGWITDLSMPDPYYILPIIFVLTALIQMLLKAQQNGSPYGSLVWGILLFALSAGWSAGVVLYVISNGLVMLMENAIARAWK